MKKLLLSLLCSVAIFAAAVPCMADTANGVSVEERIVNLPQDKDKWYISVVGSNDARYKEVLGWFNTEPGLQSLKNQVHFCPVTSDTAIYQSRYAPNVKALPTVRLQKSDGTVAYEASGSDLPKSASGLLRAIADGVKKMRPMLPWRKQMEKKCRPQPQPQPETKPETPPIDNGGAPFIDEQDSSEVPAAAVVFIAIACALAGGGVGFAIQWKKTYSQK